MKTKEKLKLAEAKLIEMDIDLDEVYRKDVAMLPDEFDTEDADYFSLLPGGEKSDRGVADDVYLTKSGRLIVGRDYELVVTDFNNLLCVEYNLLKK